LDGRFGIEADFDGERTHEGAAEDAARQLRDVIPFERFELANRDARLIGDLPQRNAPPLAGLAQLRSESFRLAFGHHSRLYGSALRQAVARIAATSADSGTARQSSSGGSSTWDASGGTWARASARARRKSPIAATPAAPAAIAIGIRSAVTP